jgi:hypothetical protein
VASALLNEFIFDDVEDMHDEMCRGFALGTQFNWVGSSEVGLDNVTLGIRSFATPDYNMARLWLGQSRWNTMVRQYINPKALETTLGMVDDHLSKSRKKSGTATLRLKTTDDDFDDPGPEVIDLRTNTVEGKKSGRQVRRRWGSCMLALTYRNVPHPTVVLTSRTTYFGYLAMMDVMVANVFAQECSAITGVHVGDMRFVWHINLAQYHGFRSLAFPTGQPRILKMMDKYVDDPDRCAEARTRGRHGWYKTLIGYRRILKSDREGRAYGDESFSSFARTRRRFHTEVHGYEYAQQFAGGTRIGGANGVGAFKPLPPLMASGLDFSALERK